MAIVLVAACAHPEPAAPRRYHWDSESVLSNFMKEHINPSFSRLSFMLFHDTEADHATLLTAANDLASAAMTLHAWPTPPGDSGQAQQVFAEYAAAMKLDAQQLVLAVQRDSRDAAQQRFTKVQQTCDSCHHFFRFGQ